MSYALLSLAVSVSVYICALLLPLRWQKNRNRIKVAATAKTTTISRNGSNRRSVGRRPLNFILIDVFLLPLALALSLLTSLSQLRLTAMRQLTHTHLPWRGVKQHKCRTLSALHSHTLFRSLVHSALFLMLIGRSSVANSAFSWINLSFLKLLWMIAHKIGQIFKKRQVKLHYLNKTIIDKVEHNWIHNNIIQFV